MAEKYVHTIIQTNLPHKHIDVGKFDTEFYLKKAGRKPTQFWALKDSVFKKT